MNPTSTIQAGLILFPSRMELSDVDQKGERSVAILPAQIRERSGCRDLVIHWQGIAWNSDELIWTREEKKRAAYFAIKWALTKWVFRRPDHPVLRFTGNPPLILGPQLPEDPESIVVHLRSSTDRRKRQKRTPKCETREESIRRCAALVKSIFGPTKLTGWVGQSDEALERIARIIDDFGPNRKLPIDARDKPFLGGRRMPGSFGSGKKR